MLRMSRKSLETTRVVKITLFLAFGCVLKSTKTTSTWTSVKSYEHKTHLYSHVLFFSFLFIFIFLVVVFFFFFLVFSGHHLFLRIAHKWPFFGGHTFWIIIIIIFNLCENIKINQAIWFIVVGGHGWMGCVQRTFCYFSFRCVCVCENCVFKMKNKATIKSSSSISSKYICCSAVKTSILLLTLRWCARCWNEAARPYKPLAGIRFTYKSYEFVWARRLCVWGLLHNTTVILFHFIYHKSTVKMWILSWYVNFCVCVPYGQCVPNGAFTVHSFIFRNMIYINDFAFAFSVAFVLGFYIVEWFNVFRLFSKCIWESSIFHWTDTCANTFQKFAFFLSRKKWHFYCIYTTK